MLKTYFARHSTKLNIDDETYKDLWKNNLIAIHYSAGKEDYACSDLESLNPADYSGRAKGVVERFVLLGKDGGYVCAVYRDRPG